MQSRYNPFSMMETKRVLDLLEQGGTVDPDILHARRTALLSEAGFPKTAGTFLMILGGLATLTLVIGSIPPWIAGVATGRAGGWFAAGSPLAGVIGGSRLLALPGLPLIAAGWWARRRGVKSIDAVERGFAEFRNAAMRSRFSAMGPARGVRASESSKTAAGGTAQLKGGR